MFVLCKYYEFGRKVVTLGLVRACTLGKDLSLNSIKLRPNNNSTIDMINTYNSHLKSSLGINFLPHNPEF